MWHVTCIAVSTHAFYPILL
uniref:Uncharacterized protein n=1 Tax=Anguilla anguilla TaxID=7936 RepID=A0A0E9S1Q3_ANGAN